MGKKSLWTSVILAVLLLLAAAGPAFGFEVNATSAILIDAGSGQIIYQQNAHEALPPASTTKILTAMLTLEHFSDLKTQFKLPADFVNVGESGIYLEPGEMQTIEDLLYALMLRSANDSAQALAIAVSGSEEAFAEQMNARTKELGLSDSHWANPHGLDDDDHYSSAYDLAMLARAALKIPEFNKLIVTEEWTMPWESNEYDRTLYNHNQFLGMYQGADGVKTGYTSKAGSCLVASATRNGLRLIGVVLHCEEHYQEMCRLMDYGFERYGTVKVAQAGQVVGTMRVSGGHPSRVDVVLAEDVLVAVKSGGEYHGTPEYDYPASIKAPLEPGQVVGTAYFTDENGTVEVPLCVRGSSRPFSFALVWKQLWQAFVSAFLTTD